MSIYDFEVKSISGEVIKLNQYKGKVILIVNTASKCGFTPQLESLEKLYKELKDEGFVILGFPCNQFANQDPASNEEIKSFCSLNYGVTFPMFEKIEVNGKNADPLYKYLKKEQKGVLGANIKWNFTKFLINREGKVVKRYAPRKEIKSFSNEIKNYL